MRQEFEYKFVRLGEGWLGMKKVRPEEYQGVVNDHAKQGWRLVQIFSPSIGVYGASRFYELIFERKLH